MTRVANDLALAIAARRTSVKISTPKPVPPYKLPKLNARTALYGDRDRISAPGSPQYELPKLRITKPTKADRR
jgi:hypothetical protein